MSAGFWHAAIDSAETAAAAKSAPRIEFDMFRPFVLPQDILRTLQRLTAVLEIAEGDPTIVEERARRDGGRCAPSHSAKAEEPQQPENDEYDQH